MGGLVRPRQRSIHAAQRNGGHPERRPFGPESKDLPNRSLLGRTIRSVLVTSPVSGIATGGRDAMGRLPRRCAPARDDTGLVEDRKSTRLNSSHVAISYAV